MKHQLTNILPLFCKLSQVKIFLREVSDTKKDTLKGGGDFQMIFQGKSQIGNEEIVLPRGK